MPEAPRPCASSPTNPARVVSRARGPGANLQAQGELEVEKVLHEVMEGALGGRTDRPLAICLGIAGVDRPDDSATMRGVMRRIGLQEPHADRQRRARRPRPPAPARARAWSSSAGTGSICYGRDDRGRAARSGGWGYVLGDEGSGYWIGRRALRRGGPARRRPRPGDRPHASRPASSSGDRRRRPGAPGPRRRPQAEARRRARRGGAGGGRSRRPAGARDRRRCGARTGDRGGIRRRAARDARARVSVHSRGGHLPRHPQRPRAGAAACCRKWRRGAFPRCSMPSPPWAPCTSPGPRPAAAPASRSIF